MRSAFTCFSLAIFTEVFNVVIDCLFDYLDCGGTGLYLIDGSSFTFKVLIHGEEMAHLGEDMFRELIDIGILVICWVIERYRNDLLVVTAVIHHFDNTDRVCSNE